METASAAFRSTGSGPPVVCLHSSASSSGQWRALTERLAASRRVIAADLYGYGQSPAWPHDRPLTIADEIRLLAPVWQEAGDRFDLVGHSYGAAIALIVALAHPERIRSLTLYEPVLIAAIMQDDPTQPAGREITGIRDTTSAAVERGDVAGAGELFVDYWMGAGSWAATPDKRRQLIASTMPKVRAEWHAIFTEPTPIAAFARLAIPTRYLVGGTSPSAPRRVAELLSAVLPAVRVIEMPGMGHMGPVTHADPVNAEIQASLEA